ncbi:MAG: hypothetical protein M3Y66_06515 [Actinomycetota bacterium]|nr:hypothetical protein [Actinomycetota bacterium]
MIIGEDMFIPALFEDDGPEDMFPESLDEGDADDADWLPEELPDDEQAARPESPRTVVARATPTLLVRFMRSLSMG